MKDGDFAGSSFRFWAAPVYHLEYAGIGAGFYASSWGPLPFAFGRVPPEIVSVYVWKPAAPARRQKNKRILRQPACKKDFARSCACRKLRGRRVSIVMRAGFR